MKKSYISPTVEIISLKTNEMMKWELGGSTDMDVPKATAPVF